MRRKWQVGDRVRLVGGVQGRNVGFTGTLVQVRPTYRVQLDPGQSRLGHTILPMGKRNLEPLEEGHEPPFDRKALREYLLRADVQSALAGVAPPTDAQRAALAALVTPPAP